MGAWLGEWEPSASQAGDKGQHLQGTVPSCPEATKHSQLAPGTLRGVWGGLLLLQTRADPNQTRLIPGSAQSKGSCGKGSFLFSFSTCPGIASTCLKLRFFFNICMCCRTFVPSHRIVGWSELDFTDFLGCFPPFWDSHLGCPAQGQELGSIMLRVPSNSAYSGVL